MSPFLTSPGAVSSRFTNHTLHHTLPVILFLKPSPLMLFISLFTVFLANAIGQVSAQLDHPPADAIPMTFKAGTFSTLASTCGYDLSNDQQDGKMPWIAPPQGAGHAAW